MVNKLTYLQKEVSKFILTLERDQVSRAALRESCFTLGLYPQWWWSSKYMKRKLTTQLELEL